MRFALAIPAGLTLCLAAFGSSTATVDAPVARAQQQQPCFSITMNTCVDCPSEMGFRCTVTKMGIFKYCFQSFFEYKTAQCETGFCDAVSTQTGSGCPRC